MKAMPPLTTYCYNLALVFAITGAGAQEIVVKLMFLMSAQILAFVGYKIHKDE